MKLLLRGHDDRYAVEQLQLALFPEEPMEPVTEPFSGDGAVSSLHTGAVWLTATAEITLHGKTGRACRRLRAAEADVPARRRLLQNTYYEAAMCLREPPAWGSLSGVRPTKLTTRVRPDSPHAVYRRRHAHDALGGPAAQAHGGAADTY